MNLFDKIMFYISVPKCVGCGKRLDLEDKALCKDCFSDYENNLYRNCSCCAKPYNRCVCSNKYLDAHFIHNAIKVYKYHITDRAMPSNNLIYSLKRDNRRDVVNFLADELSSAIACGIEKSETFLITSVPRRKSEIVKYGMDHAEVLAKAVAKRLGAKYESTLISKAKEAQKKSGDKVGRYKNAKFVLKNKNLDISGKNVIIIDDIITTGASMGAAAMLLKSAGAKKIVAASVAIAYKDDYVKFEIGDRFFNRK